MRRRSTYNIECGVKDDCSDTCGLVLFGNAGETRQQMIEKWARRPQISVVREDSRLRFSVSVPVVLAAIYET
jgi:hypothetical protein